MKCLFIAIFSILTGCGAPSQGPSVLLISPSQYSAAFDAAVAVASAEGMKPAILDPRGGYIHTEPASAGSIVEPWKPRASSPRQALENTLTLQRRTARFEFHPVVSEEIGDLPVGELRGPDLLSAAGIDLTTYEGSIELRVWVFVDRQYTRGIRRGTWTLRSESITKEMAGDALWEQTPPKFWTPVMRDVARERSMLGQVESLLLAE